MTSVNLVVIDKCTICGTKTHVHHVEIMGDGDSTCFDCYCWYWDVLARYEPFWRGFKGIVND